MRHNPGAGRDGRPNSEQSDRKRGGARVDSRSAVFVEIMAGIAVVGVLAFLISLIARRARAPREDGAGGRAAPYVPQWYEFALALALIVAIGAVLVWQFYPEAGQQLAESDWRAESGATFFFVIMVIAAALALLAFLIFLFTRLPRGAGEIERTQADVPVDGPAEAQFETPSAVRLLGLLILAIAFLLLNWIYLPPGQQYAVMLYLIYPASFAVALVLLFDKASRTWSMKNSGETMREWLLCDGIVFLLVLGFLNLLQSGAGDKYAAMVWDLINIVLFFFVFWMLDRKLTRLRFLLAHAYLIALPVLLLIWRSAQVVAEAEAEAEPAIVSWWSTIWPFFFLAVVFFVLEIIVLIATKPSDKPVIPVIKDAIYMLAYGVFLIVAIPGTGE